ncbi:MAG: hypothetical protein V1775_08365 [Bacteroidota bacterium]
MEIFAGIDGTLSYDWINQPGGMATNSHIYDFYRKLNTQGGFKEYFEGPRLSGGDVQQIVHNVEDYIRTHLKKRPGARVSLFGHSRGGFVAILVAKRLKGTCIVHFLGLYDAVDRTSGVDCDTIENVVAAYHAIRDWSRGDRIYFGNTGLKFAQSVRYTPQTFWAAHGAIGGDYEKIPSKESGFKASMDRFQGQAAHSWMLECARNEGLLV